MNKPFEPRGMAATLVAYLRTVPGAWTHQLARQIGRESDLIAGLLHASKKRGLVHSTPLRCNENRRLSLWWSIEPLTDEQKAALSSSFGDHALPRPTRRLDDDILPEDLAPRDVTVFSHASSVFAAGLSLLGEVDRMTPTTTPAAVEGNEPIHEEEPPVPHSPSPHTSPMTLDADAQLLPVEHDCEFAISSTGRLLIQSGGARLAMPADHVNQLVGYLAERFGFVATGV